MSDSASCSCSEQEPALHATPKVDSFVVGNELPQAGQQRSSLFCARVLKHQVVKREVSDRRLKASIFTFELLEAAASFATLRPPYLAFQRR